MKTNKKTTEKKATAKKAVSKKTSVKPVKQKAKKEKDFDVFVDNNISSFVPNDISDIITESIAKGIKDKNKNGELLVDENILESLGVEKNTFDDLMYIFFNDKSLTTNMKKIALKHNKYGLATKIKELEDKIHNNSKADIKKKEEAEMFKGCLGMTGIGIDEKTSFIILNVCKAYSKMKGGYDIKTSAKIQADANQIYGE